MFLWLVYLLAETTDALSIRQNIAYSLVTCKCRQTIHMHVDSLLHVSCFSSISEFNVSVCRVPRISVIHSWTSCVYLQGQARRLHHVVIGVAQPSDAWNNRSMCICAHAVRPSPSMESFTGNALIQNEENGFRDVTYFLEIRHCNPGFLTSLVPWVSIPS